MSHTSLRSFFPHRVTTALAVCCALTPVPATIGLSSGAAFAASPAATSSTMMIQDSFTRTVSGSWGSSDHGGTWTAPSAATVQVIGGRGQIDGLAPATASTLLHNATLPADMSCGVSYVVPATRVYTAVEARVQSTTGPRYRASVVVMPESGRLALTIVRAHGSSETVVGHRDLSATAKPGQVVRVEMAVTGTDPVRLRAKAWAGSTAPDWQIDATDASADRVTQPGRMGVRAYVSSSGAKTSVQLDDVTASSLAPAVPPTTPPATQEPSTPSGPPAIQPAATAGSAALGSTNYSIPAGAVFVSAAAGNDSAAGGKDTPVKTVAAALRKVGASGTIVLRGGAYHESVTIPANKPVTIQSFPGEKAWFDGSRAVGGWRADGTAWVATGWYTNFDDSPTQTTGAPDNDTPGWQFINPKYPMASHPDMVWIGGVEQRQVGSRAEVKAGTFYVDDAAGKLYLGSDPQGKVVEASDLTAAMNIQAPQVSLRGIAVRRYANSVPQMGAILGYGTGLQMENVIVQDNATTGLGVYAGGARLSRITVSGNGETGLNGWRADDLVVTDSLFEKNNDERFNFAPAAGAMKVVKSQGVVVRGSKFVNNPGPGLWFDESVAKMTVVGNDIRDNEGTGLIVELSSRAVVADNVVTGNLEEGIRVQNSDKVSVWNNTIVNNERALNLVQDWREASNLSVAGHDPRMGLPDPLMPWILRDISIGNNILQAGHGANATLAVENYEHKYDADALRITSDGNIYQVPAYGAPRWQVVWARRGTDPYVYTTLADFRAARSQEKHSVSTTAAARTTALTAIAQPLPAAVTAALLGKKLTGVVGAVR
ncbi:hypothetical protein KEM60_00325 [Austwickia sp. TVS 96-490-7B]|uniref:right-handed parallel beta-helix repeat-containing protein n=1 Tax=Austwickia sp. TVS 96-490-7B TaxID=2830843 RepID=UPI001C5921E0|nr:right-handed parallel beta-helix repeat-containing protein [Austwickia sp. TVS 96-490-7B]MBW3084141.1 hypothetical protein [Austwickia sp. TVS 96-490-7B]